MRSHGPHVQPASKVRSDLGLQALQLARDGECQYEIKCVGKSGRMTCARR